MKLKSCKRLVAVIAELSDIGKLDDGQVSLVKQPMDICARRRFGLMCRSRGIAVSH
jgi:hypothetical protein